MNYSCNISSFLFFFLVCKLLIFTTYFPATHLRYIFFIACELLMSSSQCMFFFCSFFSFIGSMWSLLHGLWVLFGSFHFLLYIYSIINPCQAVNFQLISFKHVSHISPTHNAISWHSCVLFYRLSVIHISSLLSPWYIPFYFRLYDFIFSFTRMLKFCWLYVLIHFQILVLFPLKHSFC